MNTTTETRAATTGCEDARQRSTAFTSAGPAPIEYLGLGRLYRAIVSLPASLCERGQPFQERVVFFEGPRDGAAAHLEQMLALAWCVNTQDWCEDGFIYNLRSAIDIIDEGLSEDRDARLLEIGWGGAQRIHYAAALEVDFFTCPRVHARLAAALLKLASVATNRSAA